MISFAPTTLPAVDEYWAAELGCPVETLRGTGTHVVAHGRLAPYEGLFLFARHRALIVSVPSALPDAYREVAAGLHPEDLWDTHQLAARLGGPRAIGRIVGPAFVGYGAASSESIATPPAVRMLTPQDAEAVEHMSTACDATEWEHSGAIAADRAAAGWFVGAELVALAGYDIWNARIAHIGVITHPLHRGHGYGRAVVACITQHALRERLVPQYRTLEANTASVALGRKVGFTRYAVTLALRFADAG